MKNKIKDEYRVDFTELGDEIVCEKWNTLVKGCGQPRFAAIERHTEELLNDGSANEEVILSIVYSMASRMMNMEKTINKLAKQLKEKKETAK